MNFCKIDNRRSFFYSWLLIFLFLSPLILTPSSHAEDKESSISHLILSREEDRLKVHLGIKEAFRPKLMEAVQSGLPLSFSYYLVLESPRFLLPSKTIKKISINHTITYNSVKDNYTVSRSWEEKPNIHKDFEEAGFFMCNISDLYITEPGELKKGEKYKLRVKAKLSELSLPFYLHYLVFFLPFWDIETGWYYIDFSF